MQLFKQIILKNYKKYIENKLNNRFFPYEIGNALSFALVIMEEEHGLKFDNEIIEKLNYLYQKYLLLPYEKTKNIYDKEKKEIKKEKIKDFLQKELEKEINEVMYVVLDYLKQYQNIEVKIEAQKQYDGDGVIAIIHPYYTYDIDEKQRFRR